MDTHRKGNAKMAKSTGMLVYRQSLFTRLTHWVWAMCLFFLVLTGLQIFNAHPALYLGAESGFDYDNAVLSIGARQVGEGVHGFTRVLGVEFDTTGYLGLSGTAVAGVSPGDIRAFPALLTIPSNQSLALGRVIHFFFAWVLVLALTIWLVASALNGHLGKLIPTLTDARDLPRDIANHARLRFHHTADYNVLQKLAYASVLFGAFPLMILTGLSMSPGFNAISPWLVDLFGGRQTARTLHFIIMIALIGFFVVHMVMILAAGPFNELRSILTGWYRVDAEKGGRDA